MKSPVDTGRFRANWGCTVGTPYVGTVDVYDESGRGTAVLAAKVVSGWNGRASIMLVNNLVYSLPLEYGHSQQAPFGMVRSTIDEMGGVAQGVANGSV
jgi:hypothetical protein